ncbi:30S ribosomal protein S8 [Candidatus Peregrinibacteria bacterium]|nr:30S ribosomal protein S8 [Candidatus Peregrinibacteria bacterium]
MTDPIADLLTRIRNAYSSQKEMTKAPHSSMKMGVLKVMKERNFIKDYKEDKSEKGFKEIAINLLPSGKEITFKRISKPGQRIYVKSSEIKKVNGGLGVAIVSTPKGIITGEEAVNNKVGGELICEIY